MIIRFSVPEDTTLMEIDSIMKEIGNPDLIFHDFYFHGVVEPWHICDLYDLQSLEKIENLGFTVVSDDPTPDEVDELN